MPGSAAHLTLSSRSQDRALDERVLRAAVVSADGLANSDSAYLLPLLERPVQGRARIGVPSPGDADLKCPELLL
jgi:hypothetical protein